MSGVIMSLVRAFNDGDLLYGLKDDVQLYIRLLSRERPEIKVSTQSHINKYLSVGLSDSHTAYIKEPDGIKASISATLLKGNNSLASYGCFSSESSTDPAIFRAVNFYKFLQNNYTKHDLTIPNGQCIFFKRVCKQGIMAVKDKNHIHFVLDSMYDKIENLFDIFKKTHRFNCNDCNHDSVTGSELRFIYRNREILKGTVKFWYRGQEVVSPWERFPEIHDIYPDRKQKEILLKFLAHGPQCECCTPKYSFKQEDIFCDEKGNINAMMCPNTKNILFYNPFEYEKRNENDGYQNRSQ